MSKKNKELEVKENLKTRTRVQDVNSIDTMPEKIVTLDSELISSKVINHKEFYALLVEKLKYEYTGTIKNLFKEILDESDFYKTDKHYILECLKDQIEAKSVRQNADVFNISGIKDGKSVNIWVKVIELGHYEYGISNFKIGELVHPKFKK